MGNLIKDIPVLDIGVHIALPHEWFYDKWTPMAQDGPGLIGSNGFMYAGCASVAKNASRPEEVEKEMRAQIDANLKIEIHPSHFDSHMGCVFFGRPEYVVSYLKLAQEYKIPAMINKETLNGVILSNPGLFKDFNVDNLPLIDRIVSASPTEYTDKGMEGYYSEAIKNLPTGITALLIHVAYDTDEMRAGTQGHPFWDSAWRQADFDFFSSEKAKKLLQENNIKLTTWREIGAVM